MKIINAKLFAIIKGQSNQYTHLQSFRNKLIKTGLLIACFFISNNSSAQQTKNDNKSGVIVCSEFHITKPLREIAASHPVDLDNISQPKESEDRENRKPQKFRFKAKDGPQYGNDPSVMQTEMGNVHGRAPLTNWPGINPGNFRPYDPSGAAGPTHYVQITNSTTYKIFDKATGTGILTGSLGDLWTPNVGNDGDPILLYDKTANRWFMSQFGSPGNLIYIAISATGDPTGAYYTYTFTSPEFPDYLKFSVWSDGYYMTSNQSQKVFCFDRAAMLAGNPSARSIYTSFSPPEGSGFFVPLSGDASDGNLPPTGTPCPIFSYSDNGWGTGFSDAVNIYQMAVNWVPATPTATITLAANVPTAAFDASYDQNWDDVSQPGTAQKLDGIGGVCMFRAQWKSFSGYNTTVLNWGVNISSTQRSIKWCELRQDQTTHVWSLFQEGIYTPDAATRWMGGIAMDNNGSIGLCYMKSDATSIYPGLYYTGRRSCDPLGTLPITETMVIAGTGSQTGGNRDGDYGTLALDPDGITFWHTSEYMGGPTGGSAALTRIFSFQLSSCSNIASVSLQQTGGTNPQCPGSSATFTATPFNGGTTPSYQWQVNGTNAGTNSSAFTTSSLTNGQVITCIMTSSLPGVTGSPANSANSITMTVNQVLTPATSIAITTGNNPTCSGSSVIFTATPTNGGLAPTYQWKVNGTNVGGNNESYTTSALTNGQVVSCVMTSGELCVSPATASSNNITMTVTAVVNPTVTIAQTGGNNPMCSGDSATFTAMVINGTAQSYQWKVNGTNAGTNSSAFTTTSLTNGQTVSCEVTSASICSSIVINTLGQGTGTNPSTGNSADIAAAYPTYYGNGRQQYLVLASELATLGFTTGNISSLGFRVAGTAGDPATLNGYTIKIRSTNAIALTTTFQSPATTVYGPVNYTPTLNTINTHSFTTPYFWDGVSNLVIDICFSNQVRGNVAFQTFLTSTTFVSTAYYEADGTGGASACTRTTASGIGSKRPNMIFTIGANAFSATSNTITMNVNTSLTPAVSIALTTGTNPICSGDAATFTATPVNGGSAPSFVWKNGNTIVGTNSPAFSPSSVADGDVITSLMTSSESCATTTGQVSSNAITMSVYPPISFSVITQNGDTLFAVPGFSSFIWYDNTTVIPGAVNYYYVATHSGNYSVEVTDNNGCTATVLKANVIATVNDLQSIIKDFTVHYSMGNLYLEMNTSSTASFYFQLTDAIGKEIFQKNLFLKNGKNDFEINGLNLSEGIYFVKILNSSQTMARKIFIQ